MKELYLTSFKHIKEIPEYEGYFITNKGKVYTYVTKGCRNKKKLDKTKVHQLKPRYTKKGYARVYLRNSKSGKRKDLYIHRLVAEAFIPNPENKPEVNHKDCNPSNNKVKNLEWTTRKENLKYSELKSRYRRDEKGKWISISNK